MDKRKRVIESIYITEKANMLQNLPSAASNRCVAKCQRAQYVFIVDKDAKKPDIKYAIEELYKEKKLHVESVNTINCKGKRKRVRGRSGRTRNWKKAIVTLRAGESIEL